MKLQFKHQKFQADAAKAVVDVFAGQPYLTSSYKIDRGGNYYQTSLTDDQDFTGWSNQKIVPELSDQIILKQLQKIQQTNQITPSIQLEGRYNLTIEMETGVGKTYTYIKTMYELNKHYGWSKFIIVVPSVAIREGVYKSFQITQEHFAEEYNKKIRFFIYNSAHLTEIDRFASDSSINAMIINAQAFNAKGKDSRRIYMKLDEFRSRRPIDILAKTNPILIIDEPQSVEGKQTKKNLEEFHPLLTLRYSATHKSDSIYNMVYRLDAMEAYNKHLVKKIAVKGITITGSTATESYVYLESINLSKKDPTATIQFDCKGKNGIRKINRTVNIGYNLYDHSGQMEEYRNGFIVKFIDGKNDLIEFLNGIKLYVGEVIGKIDDTQLRRIQIRETILSHIQREQQLFHKGIKVLSLFFIDEVAKYKQYDVNDRPVNGIYAKLFEEEYTDIVRTMQRKLGDEAYINYLESIRACDTHAGYFSVDKKGHMIDSKVSRKETIADDLDAYDLIMKNKELLLDRDPVRSPVRFLFSHSALREGWDNPNVFQICTLKQSSSEVRKRQEVGRGLRLCVNQDGERMDANVLGNEVHMINVLTIIASESYDNFAKGLQTELAQTIADRPRAVTIELFINKIFRDASGTELVVDHTLAQSIYYDLIVNGYIDKKGLLTNKYYKDKQNNSLIVSDEITDFTIDLIKVLDSVYDDRVMRPENARNNNVELILDKDKFAMPQFKALWNQINAKSIYLVDFDTKELIQKSIDALDSKLFISKTYFKVETGTMDAIQSRETLSEGTSFLKEKTNYYHTAIAANAHVKYDLVGKLVDATGLTRKAVIAILKGIKPSVFGQFQDNPEEFIIKAAALINDEKAATVIEHITYNIVDEHYSTDIFTNATIKGKLGFNAMEVKKHLYNHLVYDSVNEQTFATELDSNADVAVYVKLPAGFYISTPVGRYHPDWAIAFYEGTVKHIYFVAETKGSMSSMQLRFIEESKIHCAREHFKALTKSLTKCKEQVVYDVVDSYQTLLDKVMK